MSFRLSAMAAAILMVPAAAWAQNECAPAGVDPSANGDAADTYACAGAYTATGISYSSDGNLTVNASGAMNVGTVGINLTGNGADNVSFTSTGPGAITGTSGAVIDITSGSGDIVVNTAQITATAAGTTHGIRAHSTGAGDISIATSTNLTAANVATGVAGIEAVTNGGNITLGIGAAVSGSQYGVLAQTGGGGVTMNLLNGTISANASVGVAAIDVTNGSGVVTINMANNSGIRGGAGWAIRAVSAGPVAVNNSAGTIGFGTTGGAVDFSGVTGGVTFNNSGTGKWIATGASLFSAGNDVLSMMGTGQNQMVSGASIAFGAGDDVFNLGAKLTASDAAIDFGDGDDTLKASGTLIVDGTVNVSHLEAFDNSGLIAMGAGKQPSGSQNWSAEFDGVADDVLRMEGAAFIGSGNSRISMDVLLGSATQSGCETLTGAGDCVDLRGGSTAGSTLLTINNIAPGVAFGAYNPVGVTVIDVGGGTTAAEHFTLDPNSAGYAVDPVYGGVISPNGLFVYSLQYDAADQRHVVVGLPKTPVLEYAVVGSAAHAIWHMTSAAVNDRQDDLRSGKGESLWFRSVGDYAKRDFDNGISSYGRTYKVDDSYTQKSGALMVGLDLFSGGDDAGHYVVGGQIGYVGSSLELDKSSTAARFTGGLLGVYGSLWSERYFVDGTLNSNFLAMDYRSPALDARSNTSLISIGARADGGLHWTLGDVVFAEPLATLAYVNTRFDDLPIDGGTIRPGSSDSLRGALGVRLGAARKAETFNYRYAVTARAWDEFQGKGGGTVGNAGVDLPLRDDFSGGFGEVEIGVDLSNDADTLSGFVSAGVKFKNDYETTNLSAGLRLRW